MNLHSQLKKRVQYRVNMKEFSVLKSVFPYIEIKQFYCVVLKE